MTTVKILIGVAGVGKSTYIQKEKTDKDLVLSSDAIRIELFGDLHQEDSAKVFKVLHERLFSAITSEKYDTIFYDATNLSRKRRAHLYQQIAGKAEVHSVVILKDLKTILAQNQKREGLARVPESVIKRMYESLQVPRIGVDCHKIEVISHFMDFEEEIELVKGMKHDSPYHAEDVDTHIQMVMDGVLQLRDISKEDKDILYVVAQFHDWGKGITKKDSDATHDAHKYFIEKTGKHSIFSNHAQVSAFYALSFFGTFGTLDEEELLVVELIYQHMVAHDSFSKKFIRKHKLDDRFLKLALTFAEVDSKSRIVDEEIYTKYIELLGKKG